MSLAASFEPGLDEVPTRHLLWLVLVTLVLAVGGGCPPGQARQPIELPLVTSDNPEAEAEMRAAREAFDAGEAETAQQRFRAFLTRFPNDPLTVVAKLGLGQLALADGELESAKAHFDEVAQADDTAMAERGRFYGGVTLHLMGQHQSSVEALEGFVGRTIDPRETSLLLRTLASASVELERRGEALRFLDLLVSSTAPEEDKAEARDAIGRVAEETTPEETQRAADELPSTGYAWPLVATRAVQQAFEARDMERVRSLIATLERQGPLDDELREVALRAERDQEVDLRVIGAILPLTGRGREVGQLALQGLTLATSSAQPGPTTREATRIVFRDAASDPDRARAAVEELVELHRVAAIVGPVAGPAAEAAALRAFELGVPLLSLSPASTGQNSFRLLPSPRGEVSALVLAAKRDGASRFAILYPENAYGQRLREAYAEAVAAEGAELSASVGYAPDATAFGPAVGRLLASRFDALLLPDRAAKVALIAPALAAAGLRSATGATLVSRNERPVRLLLPGVAFDRDLLPSAGRYLEGALVSVPFLASEALGAGLRFAEDFQARFGQAPELFAVSAFDAVRLVEAAVGRGANSRGELAQELERMTDVETAGPSRGFTTSREPYASTRVRVIRDGALAVRPAGADGS